MDTQLQVQNQALTIKPELIELGKNINSIVAFVSQSTAVGFEKAFLQSTAIAKISEMLTDDFMKPIMLLQNNKMGFLTDVKKPGYNQETVKSCVIEAILTGLDVTGNQFNIIAAKMYTTKEGFTALLDKVNGLSYELSPKPPFKSDGTTYLPFHIKWKIGEGKVLEEDISFPVIVNEGLKIDAIIGKGERRAKSWLYKKVTGKSIGDGDVENAEFLEIKEAKISEEEVERARIWKEKQDAEKKKNSGVAIDKVQEGADKFIMSATSLEDLEKKKESIEKKYPNINLDKYETKKEELKSK